MKLTKTKPEVLNYVEATWAKGLYVNYPQREAVIHDARLAHRLEAAVNKLPDALREVIALEVATHEGA